MISVYGATGFMGSRFCSLYADETVAIPRDQAAPESGEVLYFISTTDNYNVHQDPYLDINTNLVTLVRSLEACREIDGVFNFISSWFVYGNTVTETGQSVDESAPCHPRGFYSITKKAAEELLASYCETFGMRYRILRLCNVYGRNAPFSKKKNALQYLIDELKNDRPITLYHDGRFLRDFMHVDDACAAIKTVLERGAENEIYNISNNQPVEFRDAIEHMVDKFASKSEITPVEPPAFHQVVQVKDMSLNSDKLFALGYRPRYDLRSGLDEVYD